MRRRNFIKMIVGSAVVLPLAARAQQRPVVGLLSSRSPAVDTPLIAVIRQGLNETGFVEGQNIALDYRWADGQYDRLAGLAAISCVSKWRSLLQWVETQRPCRQRRRQRPYRSSSRVASIRSGAASLPACSVLVATSRV